MTLRVLTTAAASAVLVLSGASAADSQAAAARPAPATVKVAACLRGPTAPERSAVFRGAMRTLPGATRMAMRFSLQERGGAGGWAAVKAPGLGRWRKARPGVRAFAYRQGVRALSEGSSYRVVVSFRWQDPSGKVIRAAKRRSGTCRQAGRLPNLRVTAIGARRGAALAPGFLRYTVTVNNDGRTAATGVAVALLVDGTEAERRTISLLGAGETRQLSIVAPACSLSMEARADPDRAVPEANERDNSMSAPCPQF